MFTFRSVSSSIGTANMILVWLIFSIPAKGQVQLRLDTVSGSPGDTVFVQVNLSRANQTVSALALDVSYDTSLLTAINGVINPSIGPGSSVDKELISSSPRPGVFRIGIIPASFTPASLQSVIPDGLVATIFFEINSTLANDATGNLVNNASSSTPVGQSISTTGTDGLVSILVTGVEELFKELPNGLRLFQNYPNPFQVSTTIQYDVPEEARVQLVVYNILNEKVATLVDEVQKKGHYAMQWDIKDKILSNGIYLYKLQFEYHILSRKMILIR